METKTEILTANIAGKTHRIEIDFYDYHGACDEIECIAVDGKDVTDEIFAIEELIGFSILDKLADKIDNQ